MRPERRFAVAAAALLILAFTMPPSGSRNEYQLTPFATLVRLVTDRGDRSDLVDVFGNILLFMPFGAALAYARAAGFVRAVALGAAFSTTIELVQIAIPGRWTSVDDVIMNTVGTAVGFALWRALRRRRRRASDSLLQGRERRGAGAVERGGLESR
jgi:glycopeptide antibiotics resistance protein